MRVKLVNSIGGVYLLPETLALEGTEAATTWPGFRVQGRAGRVVDAGLASDDVQIIRISGRVYLATKDALDALRGEIAAFLSRHGPYRVYRHEAAEKYLVAHKQGIALRYQVGHFGGAMADLAIAMEAADPYWHTAVTSQEEKWSQAVGATREWSVVNPGTVPTAPVVLVRPTDTNAVSKPKVTRAATGDEIAFAGTIASGKVLCVDCGGLAAWIADWSGVITNPAHIPVYDGTGGVLASMNDSWLLAKWILEDGANTIRYEDDNTGMHGVAVELRWIPAYY